MIADKTMTTQEVANRMSELFKENQWDKVQDELYADDCESIEPAHAPGMKSAKGREGLKKKEKNSRSWLKKCMAVG